MVLDDFILKILEAKNAVIEERIKLLLKPAPKGISEKRWIKQASKYLEIEIQKQ